MEKNDIFKDLGTQAVFDILIGNNDACIFSIRRNGNVFENEIEYCFNDFSIFGLSNYHNLRQIMNCIDVTSEVPQIVGIEKFFNEFRNMFTNPKDKIEEFYLPMSEKRVTCYFEGTVASREDRIYVLLKKNIANPTKYETLYSSSYKDQITGLFNYNTLKVHLEEIVGEHYIGFFDVDHFKYVNDTYSHQVGDIIISKIGISLISLADEHVIFYRRSGDEFVFMTNGYNKRQTEELIERMKSKIEEIYFRDFKVKASYGYSYYSDNCGYDSITALYAADLGMYRSKLTRSGDIIYLSEEEIKHILKTSSLKKEIDETSKAR